MRKNICKLNLVAAIALLLSGSVSAAESPTERAARLYALTLDGKSTWNQVFTRTASRKELPFLQKTFKASLKEKSPTALLVGEKVFPIVGKGQALEPIVFFYKEERVGIRFGSKDISTLPKEGFEAWWKRVGSSIGEEMAPTKTAALERLLNFILPNAWAQNRENPLNHASRIQQEVAAQAQLIAALANRDIPNDEILRIVGVIEGATDPQAARRRERNLSDITFRALLALDSDEFSCIDETGKPQSGLITNINLHGQRITVRASTGDNATVADYSFARPDAQEPFSRLTQNAESGSFTVRHQDRGREIENSTEIGSYINPILPEERVIELPEKVREGVLAFDRCMLEESTIGSVSTVDYLLGRGGGENPRSSEVSRNIRNALIAGFKTHLNCDMSSTQSRFLNQCGEALRNYCRPHMDSILAQRTPEDLRAYFNSRAYYGARHEAHSNNWFRQGVVISTRQLQQHPVDTMFSNKANICDITHDSTPLLSYSPGRKLADRRAEYPSCWQKAARFFTEHDQNRGQEPSAEAWLESFQVARAENLERSGQFYTAREALNRLNGLLACCRLKPCRESIAAEMAVRRARQGESPQAPDSSGRVGGR